MKINARNLRMQLGLNSKRKESTRNNSNINLKDVERISQSEKEEDIAKNLTENDYNNEYSDIELEDEKVKREAKELIEKTKNMMKDISKSKKNKYLCSLSSKNIRCLSKERNYNFDLCTIGSSKEIGNIQQQLFERNKQIKNLEKQLKDKNQQLKVNQQKLEDKNKEIIKLNENLTLERSNNLKAENIKLQRKIYSLEKANEENKKYYEKLIEEIKLKLENSNNINNSNEIQINTMTNCIRDINKEKAVLNEKINDNIEQLGQLNEKNEVQQKIIETKDKNIDDLKNKLSTLCALIKSLFQKENNFYQKRDNFFQNFCHIFDTPFHSSNQQSNFNPITDSNKNDFSKIGNKNYNTFFNTTLNYDYNDLTSLK